MIVIPKRRLLAILSLFFSVLVLICCNKTQNSPANAVKNDFNTDLAKLQAIVDNELIKPITANNINDTRNTFTKARNQYKRMEFYVEYFFPTTAVMINGAPVDEIELGENMIENPTGFQVMEALLYSDYSSEASENFNNEVKKMQLNLRRIARIQPVEITNEQIFDAMRLEIFRITALGITGFDTPDALQSLPEAASSLAGINNALLHYSKAEVSALQKAIDYLTENNDYNNFDRLEFITDYLDPVSRSIDSLRKKENIATTASGSALRDDAISLFQQNAFNINKFVGNSSQFTNPDKVALGKKLFNDAILSNNGSRSCASCHAASKAFTDGLPAAAATTKGTLLLRNTPTLIYAGLQRGFFYDLKAGTLEDQALDVVHNKTEMDGSLKDAAKRISANKKYFRLFKNAYNDSSDKIDEWRIQHALATYVRSLNPFNSRLDKYMRGDKSALNADEKRGFNLFMGKAKCGACHFAPVFNGTAAPLFAKTEAEVLGVPSRPDTANAKIDRDLGRFALYDYPQYKYAFKTPTLRNITKTAPYMHNGEYKTLEQVVDFYNRGGGAGIGAAVDNQTLSPDKLNLTKQEIKSIIAFLGTLEDK